MPLPGSSEITKAVTTALAEDIGEGDVSANLIGPHRSAHATVKVNEQAILCGRAWFEESFQQLDASVTVIWNFQDGDLMKSGQVVCRVKGNARSILSAERTALNFLQTLSGTATATRQFAEAVSGYDVRILDTRKTLPGLRNAQKYAVKTGGGFNHRMGLYDGALIKENHQSVSRSLKSTVAQLSHQRNENFLLEVEIQRLDQLEEAIDSGANRIMLDNFSLQDAAAAVQANDNRVKLEASGNIGLDNIRDWAETGVDYISIGALTKHVQAVDYSMVFDPL